MKTKFFAAALAALAMTPALARAMGDELPSGEYAATLAPAPTEAVADKIESALGKIEGIGTADVEPKDGTLQFTVKDGSMLKESSIEDAVESAAPGTKVGKAVPESTGATTPPSKGY
jgi:hypothetical protein